MKNLLIPEVVREELTQSNSNKNQTLNINLNQNIDKRINNYNTNTYNSTTNNTYNNQPKGFFGFIIDIITIPFKIIKTSWMYAEKKFNIKCTLKLERERLKRSKFVKKYLLSTNKVYNFEEIY